MVNNLTSILNDFLSLSKLEEGRINVLPETFMFNGFCQSIFEEVWPLLKKDQKLDHEVLAVDQEVYLDKQLIKNILFNLISNAIKYSPGDSIIQCHTRYKNGFIMIDIIDQGMGIPMADQKHLFTRFFRASNAINIQGTGLGLNIVRSYVELLHGSIHFESEEGKGTQFHIKFPTHYTS